jgi:hypothetical protein
MSTMMALQAHARGGPEQLVYEQGAGAGGLPPSGTANGARLLLALPVPPGELHPLLQQGPADVCPGTVASSAHDHIVPAGAPAESDRLDADAAGVRGHGTQVAEVPPVSFSWPVESDGGWAVLGHVIDRGSRPPLAWY